MINKIYYLEAASQNPVGCQLMQFNNQIVVAGRLHNRRAYAIKTRRLICGCKQHRRAFQIQTEAAQNLCAGGDSRVEIKGLI